MTDKNRICREHNKYCEDILRLDKILESNPKNWGALNKKGWLLIKLGKYDEATAVFAERQRADPNRFWSPADGC